MKDIDDCVTAPCKNSGVCHDLIKDFSCDCPAGFTGKTCAIGKLMKMMILIMEVMMMMMMMMMIMMMMMMMMMIMMMMVVVGV